jgi:retron-type reverse transcriptase
MDISKYFDNVQHEILMELLKPYCDQATLELMRKLLKAGYVDIHYLANAVQRNELGVPQGSIISPLLANLYLHQLDKFITNDLLPTWNTGDEAKFVAGYQTRKYLTANQQKLIAQLEIEGADKALQALLHNN